MQILSIRPKQHKTALVFSAVGLAVLLAANTGYAAQNEANSAAVAAAPAAILPPPPPMPGHRHPAPPPFENAAPATTMQVVVSRFVINPDGDIDGFLTKDGMLVRFPPHMSAQLSAAVRPNASVQINGWSETAASFKAQSITDTKTGTQVIEQPPLPGARPMPRELRGAGLSPLSVQGQVAQITTAPRGEPDGVILVDGTVIKLTPWVAQQFPALMQTGAKVSAQGYGTRNQYGTAIQATAFGSPGSLTQLYDRMPPSAASVPPAIKQGE